MIKPEARFRDDYEKLQKIIAEPTEHGLIDASAILRRLLVDEHPLLHIVARNYTVKTVFKIAGTVEADALRSENAARPGVLLDWWNPVADDGRPSREVKLDKFLAQRISSFFGESISIRDLIKYVANNCGGVHFDPAKSGKGKVLADNEGLLLEGTNGNLYQLYSICESVVEALKPMYLAVTH